MATVDELIDEARDYASTSFNTAQSALRDAEQAAAAMREMR